MSGRKKILILISIVAAMICLIIYFVILPTVQDIMRISNAVTLERVDLEKKYLRGQFLKNIIENFEKIKPQEDKLVSIFIVRNEELKFITALEEIASQYDISQKLRLQPLDQISSKKVFYSLPMGATIQGSYIETLKYLKDLEQLNYYINFSSIKISSIGKLSGQDSISTTLDGHIYALVGEQE